MQPASRSHAMLASDHKGLATKVDKWVPRSLVPGEISQLCDIFMTNFEV
jgi:hypothetical protein